MASTCQTPAEKCELKGSKFTYIICISQDYRVFVIHYFEKNDMFFSAEYQRLCLNERIILFLIMILGSMYLAPHLVNILSSLMNISHYLSLIFPMAVFCPTFVLITVIHSPPLPPSVYPIKFPYQNSWHPAIFLLTLKNLKLTLKRSSSWCNLIRSH